MNHRLLAVALLTVGSMAAQDYGGPAVLSRGPVGGLSARKDLVVLQPSLQLLGSYETGLYQPSVDPQGRPVGSSGSYGATAAAGLFGYHRWLRTVAGINYQGNFRHYTGNSYLNGTDQSLSLNVQHNTSARTTISVTGAGGTYSRGYGLTGGGNTLNYGDFSQGLDPTLSAIPSVDLLDTRTYYGAGGVDLIHQNSARLSFHAGGTGMALRRRVSGLPGMDGYSARGDVMYRLSPNSTLGVDYSFNRFQFVRAFGSSDVHVAAADYSVRLGRDWDLALRGGAFRLENFRLGTVTLDPAVAAILGQSSVVEAFYSVNYGSIFGAGLSRNFRRAGISFRYDRSITPGNGLVLTSRGDSVTAGYSYHGFRRWSLSFNAAASRLVTTFQDYGSYKTYTGGLSTSYRVARFVHLVANSAWRRYELQALGGTRNSYVVSVGLGFAPGEVPLSLR